MRVLTPDETRKRILDLMDEKGVSTKDLISLLDEKGLDLYKFLSGKTKSIRSDRLALISAVLNEDCNYFLYDTDSTGGGATATADYLGLSESSVRWIRSLPEIQKTGLDTCASKRVRNMSGALLQLIGEDTLSPVESERDYLMFRACRVVCKLIDKL